MQAIHKIIQKQHGNALFLILIAVALFAALSYAITQSGRGGGNVTRELNMLNASEILQYASTIKQATDKLLLINNCQLTELSFQADWNGDGTDSGGNSADQANTTTPSDGRCRYFHENGAGLSFISKPSFLEDTDFMRGYRLHGNLGVDGLGEQFEPELIFGFRLHPTAANLEICNAINRTLDLPENLSDTHNAQFFSYFSWGGTFGDATPHPSRVGDTATALSEAYTGCYNAVGYDGGGYIFYHVLAVR